MTKEEFKYTLSKYGLNMLFYKDNSTTTKYYLNDYYNNPLVFIEFYFKDERYFYPQIKEGTVAVYPIIRELSIDDYTVNYTTKCMPIYFSKQHKLDIFLNEQILLYKKIKNEIRLTNMSEDFE